MNGFLKVALKDFGHVGGLFPSSPFASRTVARCVPKHAKHVVEYGPGNGAVTRALLTRLQQDACLCAVEVNPDFASSLRELKDKRLEIVAEDVKRFSAKLIDWAKTRSQNSVDCVVSGIPFSFLTDAQRHEVLRNTRQALHAKGRFVVYQNSPRMVPYLKAHFSEVLVRFEPRNVLPYFIMVAAP